MAGAWPENQALASPAGPGVGVGGLDAELLEVGFYLSEGGICWTEV